jgi:hypothetical protein
MHRDLMSADRGPARARGVMSDSFGVEPRLPIDRVETPEETHILEYAAGETLAKTRLQRLRGWLRESLEFFQQSALLVVMLIVLVMVLIQAWNPYLILWGLISLGVVAVGTYVVNRWAWRE